MNEYLAILGHQPHISLAELAATIDGFSLRKRLKEDVVLFSGAQQVDQSWFHALGGTVLMAQKRTMIESIDEVFAVLERELGEPDSKKTFSFRCFGVPKKVVRSLYHDAKKYLKNAGFSVRYVGADGTPVLPVVLHDERLLDGRKGCELVVVATEEGLWVGRTIAAQNVKAYTRRDIDKPVRDTQVGLLPPKLAQVMLNLGLWLLQQIPESRQQSTDAITVFDPFCGTGVIPMEAFLRGFTVLGSDISDKAVADSTLNLNWVQDIYKTRGTWDVMQHDARVPFGALCTSADVIVTETSLGTPLMFRPKKAQAEALREENEALQQAFLQNAATSLPSVPIVCTWPFWRAKEGNVYLQQTPSVLTKLGYQLVAPPHRTEHTHRTSLLYQRPRQFVGREIVLLAPSS